MLSNGEGVAYRHPAKFILVGPMNPEEDNLRPQLLDRFGLIVDIEGASKVETVSRLASDVRRG